MHLTGPDMLRMSRGETEPEGGPIGGMDAACRVLYACARARRK